LDTKIKGGKRMIFDCRAYKLVKPKEVDFTDPFCELVFSSDEVIKDDDGYVRISMELLLGFISEAGYKIIKKEN